MKPSASAANACFIRAAIEAAWRATCCSAASPRVTFAALSRLQLDRYEALLEESDHDLFAWISGQQPVPDRHDHDVFRLLQNLRPLEAGA